MFFFFGVGQVEAATNYVDCALGTDDVSHGSGMGVNAWKNISYALTGSRMAQGDTLNIAAGTCVDTSTGYNPVLAAGTGTTTITAVGGRVSYDIKATETNRMRYFHDSLSWVNFDFTNTNSTTAAWAWATGTSPLTETFTDCTWNYGQSATGTAGYNLSGNLNITLNFVRPYVTNTGTFLRSTSGTGADNISISSGKFENVYSIVNDSSKAHSLSFINNSVVKGTYYQLAFVVGPVSATIQNNIFVGSGSNYSQTFIFASGSASANFISNPSSWNVTNNVLWNSDGAGNWTSGDLDGIIYDTNDLLPMDKSNKFIDPDFVDYTGGDYHLAPTSKASGRGLQSSLPAMSFSGSNDWVGNDVGCYANPSAAAPIPLLVPNKVAFVGDSIMQGIGASDNAHKAYNQFASLLPSLTTVGGQGADYARAIGGLRSKGAKFLVDYVIWNDRPSTIYFSIGVNDRSAPETNLMAHPEWLTEQIETALQKIADWGANPKWLGVESAVGSPPNNTMITTVNSQVESDCITEGWTCGSILTQMENNTNWKTDYYADLVTSAHPNDAGHLLMANLAEYLYFTNHTIGTDDIDVGAGARIYADGKFRDLGTANASTADLSIAPSGGVGAFNANDKSYWLDITKADDESAIIWEANHKKWKESSTTLADTDTLHTVGDLTIGKSYTLTIDASPASEDPTTGNITSSNCIDSVCTADGTGHITFTYTGGYSDHTFDIDDDISPVFSNISPASGATVSGDDTITFTDSEETDPECSLNNTDWQECESGVTSFSALTSWSSIAESDTFTLYLRDTDSSGNTGTVSVASLTKADTQAPVRSDGSPSGELASSTTSTTLSLTTIEAAICKYSTTSGTNYADMTDELDTDNDTTHTKNISGLSSGNTYSYYVRCQDLSENANDTDYLISFSIATPNTDEDTDDEKDLNVHSVKVESSQNSITITWKTDHNTKATVRYGTNKNLNEKKKDNDKEKKHKLVLEELLPDTKYYFRIKANDSDDNEDSSRIHSVKTKPLAKTISEIQIVSNNQETQSNLGMQGVETHCNASVQTYTVQQGDTLWSIAKLVYGDPTQYERIIELNPDLNTNTLKIGQELKLCQDNGNVQGVETESNQKPATDNPPPSTQSQPQQETNPPAGGFRWYNPFTWF